MEGEDPKILRERGGSPKGWRAPSAQTLDDRANTRRLSRESRARGVPLGISFFLLYRRMPPHGEGLPGLVSFGSGSDVPTAPLRRSARLTIIFVWLFCSKYGRTSAKEVRSWNLW